MANRLVKSLAFPLKTSQTISFPMGCQPLTVSQGERPMLHFLDNNAYANVARQRNVYCCRDGDALEATEQVQYLGTLRGPNNGPLVHVFIGVEEFMARAYSETAAGVRTELRPDN